MRACTSVDPSYMTRRVIRPSRQARPLCTDGVAAAAALGESLPANAVWASSTERKAFETLCAALGDRRAVITEDSHFDEVRRDGEPFDDDFVLDADPGSKEDSTNDTTPGRRHEDPRRFHPGLYQLASEGGLSSSPPTE